MTTKRVYLKPLATDAFNALEILDKGCVISELKKCFDTERQIGFDAVFNHENKEGTFEIKISMEGFITKTSDKKKEGEKKGNDKKKYSFFSESDSSHFQQVSVKYEEADALVSKECKTGEFLVKCSDLMQKKILSTNQGAKVRSAIQREKVHVEYVNSVPVETITKFEKPIVWITLPHFITKGKSDDNLLGCEVIISETIDNKTVKKSYKCLPFESLLEKCGRHVSITGTVVVDQVKYSKEQKQWNIGFKFNSFKKLFIIPIRNSSAADDDETEAIFETNAKDKYNISFDNFVPTEEQKKEEVKKADAPQSDSITEDEIDSELGNK